MIAKEIAHQLARTNDAMVQAGVSREMRQAVLDQLLQAIARETEPQSTGSSHE